MGDVEKRIRILRRNTVTAEISDELRGYSWEKPPVEPATTTTISVSDINGFCPTRRDIYVKYILRERPSLNPYMLRGIACHRLIKETITSVKKAVYSGFRTGSEVIDEFYSNHAIPEKISRDTGVDFRELLSLYRFLVIQSAAKIDDVVSKYPNSDSENIAGLTFPPIIERKIDGRPVGLSPNLSVDVFTPFSIIMDFKTGIERYEHRLALAGYAIAIEADDETDINFGCLIYIRLGDHLHFTQEEFVITDELRREFLEIRDEIAEMIDSAVDPGKPERCHRACAYFGVCNESGN
ncbi:type I-A CRISPR-associated protein Cas4/Csa1 [Geoglobus acetivorans]|uniref:Type I-A CRISPR-associated protein Cas4/Csa1 n=1 Tax=Geoglobus acetivorans TaxID=565033 RepID=A0ABZ3H0P8_GEOAI|nr:type I-A CRISPR-associated protein Cas4/Csa1 [Geoglobus acetivorans]